MELGVDMVVEFFFVMSVFDRLLKDCIIWFGLEV